MTYKIGGFADAGLAIIIGLLIGLVAAELVKPSPQPANASQQSSECPAGSYNIGESKTNEPLCKLEPTGCPYGDSIPMDMCDKFAPQPEQPAEQPKPAQPTKAAQCGGK